MYKLLFVIGRGRYLCVIYSRREGELIAVEWRYSGRLGSRSRANIFLHPHYCLENVPTKKLILTLLYYIHICIATYPCLHSPSLYRIYPTNFKQKMSKSFCYIMTLFFLLKLNIHVFPSHGAT